MARFPRLRRYSETVLHHSDIPTTTPTTTAATETPQPISANADALGSAARVRGGSASLAQHKTRAPFARFYLFGEHLQSIHRQRVAVFTSVGRKSTTFTHLWCVFGECDDEWWYVFSKQRAPAAVLMAPRDYFCSLCVTRTCRSRNRMANMNCAIVHIISYAFKYEHKWHTEF